MLGGCDGESWVIKRRVEEEGRRQSSAGSVSGLKSSRFATTLGPNASTFTSRATLVGQRPARHLPLGVGAPFITADHPGGNRGALKWI